MSSQQKLVSWLEKEGPRLDALGISATVGTQGGGDDSAWIDLDSGKEASRVILWDSNLLYVQVMDLVSGDESATWRADVAEVGELASQLNRLVTHLVNK
ncbi:immunity protein TriTu family protein [Kineococcus sp. NBC_00420]|uniref:immunity protein TriTu family protein n=1 Tax=Kineococcus sp. NBC_00420 TaxID=2903564 RepID=UPI003FA5D80E